jgi:hypothetical protein
MAESTTSDISSYVPVLGFVILRNPSGVLYPATCPMVANRPPLGPEYITDDSMVGSPEASEADTKLEEYQRVLDVATSSRDTFLEQDMEPWPTDVTDVASLKSMCREIHTHFAKTKGNSDCEYRIFAPQIYAEISSRTGNTMSRIDRHCLDWAINRSKPSSGPEIAASEVASSEVAASESQAPRSTSKRDRRRKPWDCLRSCYETLVDGHDKRSMASDGRISRWYTRAMGCATKPTESGLGLAEGV